MLWLFVIANTITALSYFSIPLALLYFVRQRKDVDFKGMLILFSLFIFTCGITHVLSIVTIWKPVYGLSAIAEVLTAIVSLATAILLWPLIPKALRIPSPSSLLLANKKLEDEILGHQETQAKLNTLNHELDQLVEHRTQELRTSESNLRLSQISGGIGTWSADLINHTQTWSENCMSILGFPPLSEPTWEDFLNAVHEDDRQRLIHATQAHIESDTQYDLEYRILTKNGNLRWMYSVGQVERNAEGKPYLMRGIVQDITQRKLAEKHSQQLGHMLEQSSNEIYTVNSQTLHFDYVNLGMVNNLGFSLDEFKNMTPLDIIPEYDLLTFTHLVKPLLTGAQKQLRFETLHQRKNGTRYPVEVSLQIYRNDPDYFVVICMDITEHQALQRSLLDERNLLLNLINNIPDYIFYKNTAGHYLLCNKKVADFFNQPIENIIGHDDFDFIDQATAQLFSAQDQAVLAQDRTCVNEEMITLPNQQKVLLETLKIPFKDSKGELLGLIGIGRDITLRKAHEAKISRLSNFYACLSKINHAIVQINNEADLFATVCTITATLSGIKLAWVGRPDAESKIFVPLAIAGENQDYLSHITISSDFDAPEGQGPTGIAYRENRIVAVNDFQSNASTTPWHNKSEQHFAWAASCAVPILINKLPYAVLNVYSKEKDFFDADVIALMAELSLDLSFALDSYAHEAARATAEKQLELSAKVFSQSQEAIVITDKNNIIISVNRAFTKVTGYQEQEVLGKNPNFLSSGQQDQAFYRALWKALQKQDYWQGELWNRHKDGTLYPEWLTISVVRDDTGDVVHHIAIFTDISAHKAAEKQIEHLAYYDALTDLPNRTLVTSRVDYELILAKRHQKSFALLFIDLDHFKNINDSLGHSIGDQVLITVAQRLLACVRDEDTVSRLGGDEFNILLIDSNEHGAAIVANKIIAALAKPIIYQGYQLHITPSIGISLYPDNGDSYELLSQNADTALYQAKDKGRNQYQFFTQAMQEKTQRRMAIENDLRTALLRNELMVYFQPQVNTQTGEIIGAEALLRWLHPQWGMVSPAEFIPVAEDCGLILPIGDWVLKQSIAQAKLWHEACFPITIAVNLSLVQFKDNDLLAKVQQTLEDHHFPAQHLELELTESIAMQSVELAIGITQQLT
ncbi:MAG: diguanylate cyclase, partial [Methyloprofundus sp.]|nr:diguanylate cyclase [Methyloprofundus sp.]